MKKTNFLGSMADKKTADFSKLPSNINHTLINLQMVTMEVRKILSLNLPEGLLQHLWVVNLSESSLTICVNSTTFANHIKFLQTDYVHIISNNFEELKNLEEIKVIVSNYQ